MPRPLDHSMNGLRQAQVTVSRIAIATLYGLVWFAER